MIARPIALQLYSLRAIFEENPLRAMRLVKEAGYSGVEFYGTHFHAELYRALLRESELVCAGWHTPVEAFEQDFSATLHRAEAVGAKFLCVPWFSSDQLDEWKRLADRLNAIARRLSPYGIRTGYHCHAHEFRPVEGRLPWDVVAQNTEPDVVLQLDTGNAFSAGADVCAVLANYPGRAQTIHLKPCSAKDAFAVSVGSDDLPWEEILSFCETSGETEWLVVEYESELDPVRRIGESAAFLRALRPASSAF